MILVEYMLRSELYLVLEGKFNSTFDQFMIQFMILVYAFMLYIYDLKLYICYFEKHGRKY